MGSTRLAGYWRPPPWEQRPEPPHAEHVRPPGSVPPPPHVEHPPHWWPPTVYAMMNIGSPSWLWQVGDQGPRMCSQHMRGPPSDGP